MSAQVPGENELTAARPFMAAGSGASSNLAGVVEAKITVPRVSALDRERLDRVFDEILQHRVGVVTAPAGSGKTTVLAQLAAHADAPVAWYRADPSDGGADTLLAYLEAALTAALADLRGGWHSVAEAASVLQSWHGGRALLVIDDLHALQSTPAEAALQQFLEYSPDTLTTVVASRHPPTMNLSRLRVAGDVVDITADDLRFRTWEVERLFHGFYREHLRPEDLAALARRTEGWAAGLQLFHLATRAKPPEEQRRVLAELTSHWGLVREYLTDNVLHELDPDVRSFVVETSVLGRLSGAVCDQYLQRTDSESILARLERDQLFTIATGAGWYRYHEVLRSHLEAVLVEQLGEDAVRERYRRAAEVLERAGVLDDALSAYCRAEDAGAVARLLGHEGEQLAAGPPGWLDFLPPAIRDHDPWVLLAAARRHRAEGQWTAAVHGYRHAEQAFGNRPGAGVARAERNDLLLWEDPALHRRHDWIGCLRAATVREPLAASAQARRIGTPEGDVAAGLAALIAGAPHDADRLLAQAVDAPGCTPTVAMVGYLGLHAARMLQGAESSVIDLEWLLSEADTMGAGWLARTCRAMLALSDRADGIDQAAAVAAECRRDGDRWGAAVASLLQALGGLGTPQSLEPATVAAQSFAELGAGTLYAWSMAAAALASAAVNPDAGARAREAANIARVTVVPGAEIVALLARAAADPDSGVHLRGKAEAMAAEMGLALPVPHAAAPPPSAPVRISLLGGLAMEVDGRAVDVLSLKPRARSLLRLLALSAGRPLHREAIVATLWPDSDADTGMRLLHVALTALRHALAPDATAAEGVLVREGEAYRLLLPPGSDVDVRQVDEMLTAGHRARSAGNREAAIACYERVLWLHTDDLLPEEGPAEWVVDERQRLQMAAADAAQALVELHVARGDTASALMACSRGLHLDRYRDALWRMLIAVHASNGDVAAAAETRRRYHELLVELGVDDADR